jgi:cyclohexa-1,5-dienecarbonyl-CoA hydratase
MADTNTMVRTERSGGVMTVTLDRPPLNVLNIPMIEALATALESAAADPSLSVVHLRGAGVKGFSAGVDVADHTPDRIRPMIEVFHRVFRTMNRMDQVTVAEVFGACLGGGCELAALCDFVITAEDAKIGQPEIELACFPPVAAAAFGAIVGPKRAADLVLTGRIIDGREAERIGLATRAVPGESLEAETKKIVSALAARSRPVLALTKKALRACHPGAFEKSLAEAERIYLEELAATEDMKEGLTAFLEKRRPTWSHR